jgi:hypothetical protein
VDHPNIVVAPEIRESRTLGPMVDRANKILADILSQSREPVTAEWDRMVNVAGVEGLALRLKDFAGSVTGSFNLGALQESDRWLRFYLLGIFDGLLEKRFRHLAREFENVPAGEAD